MWAVQFLAVSGSKSARGKKFYWEIDINLQD